MHNLRHDPLALRAFAIAVGDRRLVDALDRALAREAARRRPNAILGRLAATCGVDDVPTEPCLGSARRE